MTLLIEVMERPLDPGYAAAHERRASGGQRPSRTGRVLTVLAAVGAGTVLVAAVLPLRAPGETSPRTVLSEEIAQRTEDAEATVEQIGVLRSEIADVQAGALTEDADEIALLERLQAAAGSVPLTGPAAVVTLDDASSAGDPVAGDPREQGAGDDGQVIDVDLQIVVNGLWAAGAEAVAVDDVRLTSLSAIRNAGQAVLVDQQPLQPPYEVVAIGPSQQLQTRFADSAAGRYLAGLQQNYGVRASVEGTEDARVPASGSLRLRYAEPATTAGPGSGAVETPEQEEGAP